MNCWPKATDPYKTSQIKLTNLAGKFDFLSKIHIISQLLPTAWIKNHGLVVISKQ